ncbi:unnamed protein product [Schistosoma mattheei]|uniref:Uncharacterized protein n=1 Tax=Schistosoma mattheei TaxID=31246 RepID=A0A183PG33_9TREM|nr:unnamed protein product [Schistosoma mattheei]
MVRQNDQKAREFILELQKQVVKCNFGDQLHVQLRDRIIAGINIPSLERELLKMPNCSFQDARTACINYEAVNELDIQSMKISDTLLSRHDELQSQGQSNLRSFNSDSYSRVNMKGNSHDIVPGMTFPNDSHISNGITCNIEENMLNEPNHDRKPDVVWIDAGFSNDPTLCDDSPNEFHENISEESNPNVILMISVQNRYADCIQFQILQSFYLIQCRSDSG